MEWKSLLSRNYCVDLGLHPECSHSKSLTAGTYPIHNSRNLYNQYQLSFISERKEGEEAPVESQGKKRKKTFNSTAKERSTATLCLSSLLPLHKSHRSSAPLIACALSLLCPRSITAPLCCWDPTLTYYYVHAIEPSDRSHPLHHTVEDDGMMRSILYKTC